MYTSFGLTETQEDLLNKCEFSVKYDRNAGVFFGRCQEYPTLFWRDPTADDALFGIMQLVAGTIRGMLVPAVVKRAPPITDVRDRAIHSVADYVLQDARATYPVKRAQEEDERQRLGYVAIWTHDGRNNYYKLSGCTENTMRSALRSEIPAGAIYVALYRIAEELAL